MVLIHFLPARGSKLLNECKYLAGKDRHNLGSLKLYQQQTGYYSAKLEPTVIPVTLQKIF